MFCCLVHKTGNSPGQMRLPLLTRLVRTRERTRMAVSSLMWPKKGPLMCVRVSLQASCPDLQRTLHFRGRSSLRDWCRHANPGHPSSATTPSALRMVPAGFLLQSNTGSSAGMTLSGDPYTHGHDWSSGQRANNGFLSNMRLYRRPLWT